MARHEDEERLAIPWDPVSNGEYLPPPTTPLIRESTRRALRMADESARRLGMSRRRFLSTLPGAAVSLLALSACASEERAATGTSAPGGTFSLPPESTLDPDAAGSVLSGEEFIMDVQCHLLEYDLTKPASEDKPFIGQVFPQVNCGDDDPRSCFSIEHFMDEMFLKSDTSFVVLSAIPIPSMLNPFNIEVMEETMRVIRGLCQDDRVLAHGHAMPNLGDPNVAFDEMRAMRDDHDIAAWKVYTHLPGNLGFSFDDHDPSAPQVGRDFLSVIEEIGPPIVCVHKGFAGVGGGSPEFASPVDIGPAALEHPDLSFVVYHSGFDSDDPAGPYEDATRDVGVNRLVSTLLDNGIEPNANVYAELGSTWFNVMRDPDKAAHTVGKLLKYVGEDRVVWGTDSIWYGTPQPAIQAFRAFEITPEYQERYGYPALTPEIKAKIFGRSSAALYGVDADAVPCPFTREELQDFRVSLPAPRPYGPTTEGEIRELIRMHGGLI